MRYNDDIINAESWNTDLKRTVIRTNSDSDEIAGHQSKTIPKSSNPDDADLSAPNDAQGINHTPEAGPLKAGPSEKNKYESRNRIKRRKKRGMFLLSGIITGLVSRSRDPK